MMNKGKVIGVVFGAIIGVAMACSISACPATQVSNCSEVTSKSSCANMYQLQGNTKYQCMAQSNGTCVKGPVCQ
jgi:hypothetical protein